jgi:hypothetical protein
MRARAFLTGWALSWMGVSLWVLVLGTAAWAASSSIVVPADLPNRSDLGDVRLRWALIQDPGTVRAGEWPNRRTASFPGQRWSSSAWIGRVVS